MKKLLVLIIAIFFTCAGAYAGGVGDPNFTKVYETSKGNVTFAHQIHAETTNDCAFCHGVLEQFGGMNKDMAHKGCKTCHKRVNEQEGATAPTTCTGCHKR
jgi:hypothetical protein